MKDKLIKQWVKERDKTLEKMDVDLLIEFLEKWHEKGIYPKETVDSFKAASYPAQLGSLCKMIIASTNIPKPTKQKAMSILDNLGWSYYIN